MHNAAASPAPVCLDDFGDTLTVADLCRLLQRSKAWIYRERWAAKRRGIAPDLPAALPADPNRYRKVDVAEWMATGRSSARRRIA